MNKLPSRKIDLKNVRDDLWQIVKQEDNVVTIKGSITDLNLYPDTKCIIAHGCNDIGAWGAGVSGVISNTFPNAENMYRKSFKEPNKPKLGDIVYCTHWGSLILIANMITQKGIRSKTNKHPFSYIAFKIALEDLINTANKEKRTRIHIPKIGAGLGGGDWDTIYKLIKDLAANYKGTIVIHEYP